MPEPLSAGTPSRRSLGRRLARLAGIALVQCLLVAALGEAGARVYAHLTQQVRGSAYHPAFGWKPLPDVVKRGLGWGDRIPARTNSHGWRDRETPYAKPEGVRRLVALGDSFTFGHGVDYGSRFSERLESQLEGVEVVNLGVFAYGPDQELRVLEVEGRRYQPDIVLLGLYLGNDLEDLRFELKFSWPKPYYLLRGDALLLVPPHESFEVWLRGWSYIVEFVFQRIERGHPRSRRAAAWETADTVPLFAQLVRALSREVHAAGAELLVMVIHPREGPDRGPTERNLRVRRILDDAGIATLDTYEAFARETAAGAALYLEDGHWNVAGNQLAAELLAAELARSGWLDSAPPRVSDPGH